MLSLLTHGSQAWRRLPATSLRGRSVTALFATSAEPPSVKHKKKSGDAVSPYSKTVLLPETTFDQRANAVKREPELQRWWQDNRVYEKLSETNSGDKFILHDGPPYANGELHIGHALNKILKDFVNRYQILRGRKVRFVPGWDCHGLPIELKVLQGMKQQERESLTPIALRKKAAEFATRTMESQRVAFQRYGVWGDWQQPYLTLQREYEAAQIRVFGDMVTRGHIYRGKKPVHWSPSSRTALAEAELEYPDNHVSTSIFVGFRATQLSPAVQSLLKNGSAEDVRVAIWTTTPWTIPANLAVAVNGELPYCLASHPTILNNARLLIARDLAPQLASKFGLASVDELELSADIPGSALVGTVYEHPLARRSSPVLVGGDYVTTESGTGLVHTAPGHGQQDYQTGLQHGLSLLSPVDDAGKFTAEAGDEFVGLDVLGAGNMAVIDALQKEGVLIKQEMYPHKYPYDWRTKKPTIFRATEQWFASVSTFREEAMREIDRVQWIPAAARNRIASMTESRGDWCISRQRSWGVPIPVFYNKTSGEPLMTAETLQHIEKVFREHGSDGWWEMSVAELLPEGPLRAQAEQFQKGSDTMDVWFDSGTSWAGVLQQRGEALGFPADLYLEGSDQARGWFQSSLLTAVASQGVSPYKSVLTHGFVLDEKGFKMSKSQGNIVSPYEIIDGGSNQKDKPAYGADTLRMWVSFVDYSGDVCIGPNIVKQVFESYRKIRNTMRYLLGSLSDFDPSKDAVPYDSLPDVDKYMLGCLGSLARDVEGSYDAYQFFKVHSLLVNFATIDLSAFYLDASKDRLYISSKNDPRRRACQTVLQIALEQFTSMFAPILPHLAEDVWQNVPYRKPVLSVFENGWIGKAMSFPPFQMERWQAVKTLRNDVNIVVETARRDKLVGANMECALHLHAEDKDTDALLQSMTTASRDGKKGNEVDDLRYQFMVSQVVVHKDAQSVLDHCPKYHLQANQTQSGVTIGVTRALGLKCQRCWFYCDSVGSDHAHPTICSRCATVIHTDGHQL